MSGLTWSDIYKLPVNLNRVEGWQNLVRLTGSTEGMTVGSGVVIKLLLLAHLYVFLLYPSTSLKASCLVNNIFVKMFTFLADSWVRFYTDKSFSLFEGRKSLMKRLLDLVLWVTTHPPLPSQLFWSK